MALSGTFQSFPVENFGLKCTWSGRQNKAQLYTEVTLNIFLHYYKLQVGARTDNTAAIGANSTAFSTKSIDDLSSGYKDKLLYSYTAKVHHEADGTKTDVTLKAEWKFNGTYSGKSIGTITATATVDLDAIDVTAPTVTLETSSVSSTNTTLIAKTDVACDKWDYSIDDGSTWTNFSSVPGLSAGVTISNLSPNTTYNIKIRARKESNNVYGTVSMSVKTLGGTVLNAVNDLEVDVETPIVSFTWTIYNPTYTHTLEICNGETVLSTFTGLSGNAGKSTKSVVLSSTQRSNILNTFPNSKSAKLSCKLTTFANGEQMGETSTANITVFTTEANSAPRLGTFNYADDNSNVVTVTGSDGILVQQLSELKVWIGGASGSRNGARIAYVSATIDDKTVSSQTETISFGVVNKSGRLFLKVAIIDTRGYSSTDSREITVIPYESITFSTWKAVRVNSIDKTINLAVTGKVSPVTINDGVKNTLISLKYRFRKTTSASYSDYIDLSGTTVSGTGFEYSENAFELPITDSYYIEITAADKFGTTAITMIIPEGEPLMSFRYKKVGINKINPEAPLDVNGNIMMNGFNVMGIVNPDLSDETDLNSITDSGIYFRRRAVSDTTKNYPSTEIGMLEVFTCTPNLIIQRYTHRNPPYTVYLRSGVNGTWYGWIEK